MIATLGRTTQRDEQDAAAHQTAREGDPGNIF